VTVGELLDGLERDYKLRDNGEQRSHRMLSRYASTSVPGEPPTSPRMPLGHTLNPCATRVTATRP
jgi:hypothetical protein